MKSNNPASKNYEKIIAEKEYQINQKHDKNESKIKDQFNLYHTYACEISKNKQLSSLLAKMDTCFTDLTNILNKQ